MKPNHLKDAKVQCKYCGEDFYVTACRAYSAKFCSQRCRSAAKYTNGKRNVPKSSFIYEVRQSPSEYAKLQMAETLKMIEPIRR